MKKKMGRPPKVKGERRRSTSFSLGDAELEGIRELARLKGESQAAIVGELILRELTAEMMRRKRRQDREASQ